MKELKPPRSRRDSMVMLPSEFRIADEMTVADDDIQIPRIVRSPFSRDVSAFIRKTVEERAFKLQPWHETWGRDPAVDPPAFRNIHLDLTKQGKQLFGTDVFPTYIFVAMYGHHGQIAPHVDRPPCELTVGYCVRQDAVWPFFIDGVPYDLRETDAILYSGTRHRHWRKPYPGRFCDMLLFHFMTPRSINRFKK